MQKLTKTINNFKINRN